MQPIKIILPMTTEILDSLKAGDNVLISGSIYTGRDAAHKRLIQLLEEGKPLPIPVKDQVIYYVGPSPAKEGYAVGPAGPTTSYRMDSFTPQLIHRGLRGMIGKGKRSKEVIDAMVKYGAVYFGAVGGAAALISKSILSSEVVAYDDLGTEAIHRFVVKDFPAIVIIDRYGNNLYETGPAAYRKEELVY